MRYLMLVIIMTWTFGYVFTPEQDLGCITDTECEVAAWKN